MKTFLRAIFISSLALVTVHAIAEAATTRTPGRAPAKKKETPTIIKGEVVELSCYLADSKRKGPEHAECARAGISAGNPVGILTIDGRLYLALAKEGRSVNDLMAPFSAKHVKVSGRKVTKGYSPGITGIVIDKVEEIPAPKPSSRNKKRTASAE
jgi:ABC-type glycerol-3-phosphate transport system substrate-binding protein